MDVICSECGREFFILTDVWDNIVEDVSNHQRGECPHCGEGMCFTCQYVPAEVFAEQGVTRGMPQRPSRNRERRSSRPRRKLTQKPNYPF